MADRDGTNPFEQLERLYMSAPVGLCYVDRDLRYVHVNEWLAALNGLPVGDHIGRTIGEVLPEVAIGVEAQFREVIETGEPILQGRVGSETSAHAGGGRHFLHNYYPDKDADGRVIGIMCAVQEITDRVRVEEALRRARDELEDRVRHRTTELRASEGRLRLMADSLPVLISYVDRDHRFRFNNASYERWFGYSKHDLEGRHMQDVLGSAAYEAVRPHVEGALADHPQQFEQEIPFEHGGARHVRATYVPHHDVDGEVLGFYALVIDVTESRRAEEERRGLEEKVAQSQKLESLGVLAGGIAHDFNNLLVAILGFSELALHRLSPGSPARPLIEEIMKGGQRAADLCSQMLAYAGKGEFVVGPVSLNEVVEDMSNLLEASVSKKASLEYLLASDLPAVEADTAQLQQVIMNLIVNASEAIGAEGGVIQVSTGSTECDRDSLEETTFPGDDLAEGVYVYFEVSDTGSGMTEETKEKLFDPFFTTKFTGRGLGLASVRGIARGHKAAIEVSSDLGKGATIRVLFPATRQPPDPLVGEAPVPKEWRGSGTILLVDDDETVLAVGRMMLADVGFEVRTAHDGRDAVEVFRQHQAEIVGVVLDLTMPHMDGEETLRELRRMREDVRVVLTSGYGAPDGTRRLAGQGLSRFVQKPYQADTLVRELRWALEGTRTR